MIPSKAIKAAKPGDTLHDPDITGLQLRIFATKSVWYLRYRTQDGQERRPSLGVWPGLDAVDAPKAAKEILAKVASGGDPSREWSAARHAETVADLLPRIEAWTAERLKRRKMTAKHAGEIHRQFRTYIVPAIGRMRVADVDSLNIEAALCGVRDGLYAKRRKGVEGGAMANRVRATLHTIFNLCEKPWKLRPLASNPVGETERDYEAKRRRVASSDELARLAPALRARMAERPHEVTAILVLFMTGARVNEIAAAPKVAFRGHCLVLDKHKTANVIGAKTIFLPPLARALIAAMPPVEGDLLFGAIDLRPTWEAVRKVAGCPDLQLRDARRTFASAGLTNGQTLDQLAQVFGHTSTQTTRRYAHLLQDANQRITHETGELIADKMGFPHESE